MSSTHHKISIFLAILSVLVTGVAYWWSQPTKINPVIVQKLPEGPLSGPVRRVLGLKISINKANLEDLMALPGVGPGRANKILQWRENHGPFQFTRDLQKVPGIGPKIFEELSPYISLHSASQ